MLEFLTMAKKGKITLFGTGDYRINPIHGQDLAEVCLNTLTSGENEIAVGGPETLSHNEIARLAYSVLQRKGKISRIPMWVKNLSLAGMRLFTSSKTYGPIEFIWTALSMDNVAPAYGRRTLKEFFLDNINEGFR
jgi:nucleoside-diphosphate-sugar epimerase